MSQPFNFKDKTVLVVGGTSGINRGIAGQFAAAGAKVAVASRSLQKVDDTVAELGAGALGFAADVRDFAALEKGVDEVVAQWGKLDVVVSGAAGNFPAKASDMSPNGFKSVVDIDLLGSFNVAKAVYPHLQKPGAALIHISAPQAQLATVGQMHVSAAKAGVDMLTKSLALEWGPEGVRVNSVIPGPIDGTEGMARLAPTEQLREACRRSVPLQRMGSTDDIGFACLFLASPWASYINGAVLPVDGGWLAGGASLIGTAAGQASAQTKAGQ